MATTKKGMDKHYISDIDTRLAEFDQNHSKSASQIAEIEKYQRVYQLRDHPTDQDAEKDIWDF